MPFFRGDTESFDEIINEVDPADLLPDFADQRPSGQFEYHSANAQFDPAKLGRAARAALQALLDAGATEFRVTYDGGYDEGFAHPDAVFFGDARRPAADVIKELASADAGKALHDTAAQELSGRYAFVGRGGAPKWVEIAFDELAHELASQLLGDGYGTGEYELYGAFVADLRGHELTDDPAAPPPPGKE